jgi:hypothetical protein
MVGAVDPTLYRNRKNEGELAFQQITEDYESLE